MNLNDVIHQLIDRAGFHSESLAKDAHDTVTANEQGFKSLEEYRKAKGPVPTEADETAAIARPKEIQDQRKAQQEASQQQAAAIPQPVAERPAPPAVVADTPASPTADPASL